MNYKKIKILENENNRTWILHYDHQEWQFLTYSDAARFKNFLMLDYNLKKTILVAERENLVFSKIKEKGEPVIKTKTKNISKIGRPSKKDDILIKKLAAKKFKKNLVLISNGKNLKNLPTIKKNIMIPIAIFEICQKLISDEKSSDKKTNFNKLVVSVLRDFLIDVYDREIFDFERKNNNEE